MIIGCYLYNKRAKSKVYFRLDLFKLVILLIINYSSLSFARSGSKLGSRTKDNVCCLVLKANKEKLNVTL